MNPPITTKDFFGLALAVSLAGGGLIIFNAFETTNPVQKTATVHELLRNQHPGQISYLSFPITEHIQNQLESNRKIFPFPGGK